MPPNYHLSNIRTLLIEGFPEDDLRTFCFDTPKFKPVHHELADLTGKKAIVQHLLEFAERQECLDALLAWTKNENPAKYEKHRPYFDGDTAPTPAEFAEARARYIELMIDRHQDLDFVGIPELKDRQALHLDEVFINLQAEVEVENLQDITITSATGNIYEYQVRARYTGKGHYAAIDDKVVLIPYDVKEIPRETIKRRVSVNQALREYPKMVILGDPGAGKTTLLKYITLAFAQKRSDRLGLDEERLPIFVRLYDFVAKRASHSGDYSLVDYLYTQAHENLLLDLPAGFFEAELEQGQCCVCLDGLDELGGAGLRREVTAAVASLASRYPRTRYLITSRLVGYEEAPLDRRDFTHHTILPFSEDNIRHFVQQWYAAREKDPVLAKKQAESLTQTIMAQPPLKTLAANPLMLTIIALVHRIEAELPHERVKLYDKCVTALVETWEQVKRLSVEDKERPHYKKRRHLLEQLAYWLHTQPLEGTSGKGRAREVAEGDLKAQVAQFLLADPQLTLDKRTAWQEAEDFVAMAKARTGLLVERGEGVYSFAHLTFQEYLAAAYLKYEYAHSIDELWRAIQPHLHDPAWREVILLLLGSLNEFRRHPTELVRRIFKSTDEYEDLLHRHLFLAAHSLADRVQVDAVLHDAIVDELLMIVRDDELGKKDAFDVLAMLQDDDRVIAEFLNLSCDPAVATETQNAAIEILGQLNQANKTVISRLLALAHDSNLDTRVRRTAAEALGRLGQANEAANLLMSLSQDYTVDDWLRLEATEALSRLVQIKPAILAKILVWVQSSIEDDLIQSTMIWNLGQLGCTDETANLIAALAYDPNVSYNVRSDAAKAIGRLGRLDEAAYLLLALASDRTVNEPIRSEATETIGELGWANQAVLDGLMNIALDQTIEVLVRSVAIKSLMDLGQTNKIILTNLLAIVQNRYEAVLVRLNAARALDRWSQTGQVASLLLDLARDQAIGPALVGLLSSEELGQLGRANQAIIDLLMNLAQDHSNDDFVRRNAAEALGQAGRINEATNLLLALAHDDTVDVFNAV